MWRVVLGYACLYVFGHNIMVLIYTRNSAQVLRYYVCYRLSICIMFVCILKNDVPSRSRH